MLYKLDVFSFWSFVFENKRWQLHCTKRKYLLQKWMNNGTANDNGYQMPQQIKDISSKILATLMKNNETANIGRPSKLLRGQSTPPSPRRL